jgi:phosphoribosylanthranilate isomerase
MSLKTKVKAGNITNLSDARYCAGMGVDWLSFPVNAVNPTIFKEITDWVTGPEFVLEVSEMMPLQYLGQYPVTTLEISFHQLTLIDQLPAMQWMVTLPLSEWSSIKNELIKYKDKICELILDLDRLDQHELRDLTTHFNVLVNQSEKYSIVELLNLPIEGINVTGENELKPGLKDFDKLASILEELEVLD